MTDDSNMTFAAAELHSVLQRIRSRATALDRSGDWPAQDLAELAAIGLWRWSVPEKFGGDGIDPLELHFRYEQIASASLATALVVSQRDSAVGLIDGSPGSPLHDELLPPLAAGEIFATIGIAQLTTSRQGGAPALRADKTHEGYLLRGLIPWSTGPAHSQFVIAGAALEDGQQILFALPVNLKNVEVQAPLPLVALRASWTTQIQCRDVELDSRWLLRGPAEKVLAGPSRGVPIGQAFLALGLCRGAIDLIQQHTSERAAFLAGQFTEQLSSVRAEVIALGRAPTSEIAEAAPRVRAACNDLAVRITQAAVALYKGSALLADHPAQRLAREAMFLLVWSCPDPVIDCTVRALAES